VESILEAIGNTPLIRLRRCAPRPDRSLSDDLETGPALSAGDDGCSPRRFLRQA